MKFEQSQENKIEENKLADLKKGIRDALEILITEKEDLDSAVRYMLLRPLRAIARGGVEANERLKEEAGNRVIQFCALIGEKYPKTQEEKENLLSRLNSPEMEEKMEKIITGESNEGRMGIEEAQQEANLLRIIAERNENKGQETHPSLSAKDYRNALEYLESLREGIEIEGNQINQLAQKAIAVFGLFPGSAAAALEAAYSGIVRSKSLEEGKVLFRNALKEGFAKVAEEFKNSTSNAERNFSREEMDTLLQKAEKLANK